MRVFSQGYRSNGYWSSLDEMPVFKENFVNVRTSNFGSPLQWIDEYLGVEHGAVVDHGESTEFKTVCDINMRGQFYMFASPALAANGALRITHNGNVTLYSSVVGSLVSNIANNNTGMLFGSLPSAREYQTSQNRYFAINQDEYARYDGLPFESLKIEYRPYIRLWDFTDVNNPHMRYSRAFYRLDRG